MGKQINNIRIMNRMYLHYFSVLLLIPSIMGHGNMIRPRTWWNPVGWDGNHVGCGVLDLPDTEFEHHNSHASAPDCMDFWFSNHVEIPGHATLPDHVSQPEVKCIGQAGHHDDDHKFPWWSPGTTKIFGSCGTLGGIPAGCHGDYTGKFGDCCTDHCDAFALGKNAEEYDWSGHDVPVTTWIAGSVVEVQWFVSANHAGGYSYRLCKIPHNGINNGDLTEECFQENQLDFVGDKQWVIYHNPGHWDSPDREEVTAKRTTEGTYPPGSMWTANPIYPHMEEGGDDDRGHGHIVDMVHVPSTLEPGEYVLSFRWDSKCSPQVWTSCANIEIL